YCPIGDLNGDCKVNLLDLDILVGLWLCDQGGRADLDNNQRINTNDFARLAQNWLEEKPLAPVLINELLARNIHAQPTDPQGEYEDWIELYNFSDIPFDVGGMYLTDDRDNPTKWPIPADRSLETTIEPGGFLIIWADQDTDNPGLHANFNLDAEVGEQLALYDVDGINLIDQVAFGEQTADVSWGREPDGGDRWLTLEPSAGESNKDRFLGVVADTKFSHDRGFYQEPFLVTITTETPAALIYFTTDGSDPITADGTPTPTAQLYDDQTNRPYIATSTCLRAAAVVGPGWKPTNIDTHTYIFPADVLHQATGPAGQQVVPDGYPVTWPGGSYGDHQDVIGDYQVDPDIVNHADPADRLTTDDLRAAPTICVTMNKDLWFDPVIGIYVNETLSKSGKEYACSFEYFDPDGSGKNIQQNCAVAMAGGVSGGGTSLDRWKDFKLSMRPRFKQTTDDGTLTGGGTRLSERIFPDSPVNDFESIVLDGVLNHSWLHPASDQRNTAKYIQDQVVSDLHNASGGYSPHGAYAHLYLNGLYWGMYYIHERPDHGWAAEIFGGEKEEYDAIKHNAGNVINDGEGGAGAYANYNAMLSAASAAAADPANQGKWQALAQQLDIDNLITYLLSNYYPGNHDWPTKNWYATHRVPDGQWRYHTWDAEHTFEGQNVVGESPSGLHNTLKNHPEYKIRWADHIHRHFHHDGALTYPRTAEAWRFRMAQIDRAIRGESGRWGDNRVSIPYSRSRYWLSTQNDLLTNFFPNRTAVVESWLSGAGLYPATNPPDYLIDGQDKYGGQVSAGALLTLTNPGGSGTIYYTLNGADPRRYGGSVNGADAQEYSVPITLTHSVRVKARVRNGGVWSALSDAVFAVGPVRDKLRITEMMYHPAEPPA
ncbi:MAG: CotH kinase family protein, partial [Sedimentisphaerales bacterium]|nr:CotH kinase family protein [Sedimentisphaerales bacterium]